MAVGFVDDGGKDTQVFAFTSDVVDRQSASLADQGVSPDEIKKLVDLSIGQIVREEDGCQTVEGAGWEVLIEFPRCLIPDHSPKIDTRYSMLFGR